MPIRCAEDSVRLRAAYSTTSTWQPHFLVFPRFFPLVASTNIIPRGGRCWETARKFALIAFIVSANRYYRIRGGVAAKEIISNVQYGCDLFFSFMKIISRNGYRTTISQWENAPALDAVDHLFTRMSKSVSAPRNCIINDHFKYLNKK